jgi:hypothetical protein
MPANGARTWWLVIPEPTIRVQARQVKQENSTGKLALALLDPK